MGLLADYASDRPLDGPDDTLADVEISGGTWLRIERVSAVAPLLQGVPALLMALPAVGGEDKAAKPAKAPSEREAKQFAAMVEGVLIESVSGVRQGEDGAWKRLRLVRTRNEESMAEGRFYLQRITSADQLTVYNAILRLHTGREVGVMLASLFRGAVDVLATALAREMLRHGPGDDPGAEPAGAGVEPGADGRQRDGDVGGAQGGAGQAADGGDGVPDDGRPRDGHGDGRSPEGVTGG